MELAWTYAAAAVLANYTATRQLDQISIRELMQEITREAKHLQQTEVYSENVIEVTTRWREKQQTNV